MKELIICLLFIGLPSFLSAQNCKYDKGSNDHLKSISTPFHNPILGTASSQLKFSKMDTSYFVTFTYISQAYKAMVIGQGDDVNFTLNNGEKFTLKTVMLGKGDLSENVLRGNSGMTTLAVDVHMGLHQIKQVAEVGISKVSFQLVGGGEYIEEQNKNKYLNAAEMKAAKCVLE